MAGVEGVIETVPKPDPFHHVPDSSEFTNTNREAHSTSWCSCGQKFEFFGKYFEGQDATRLARAQHIYTENAEWNSVHEP